MNPTHHSAELDDHLVQVLEDYLADLEAGTALPREELLARYPELAESLDACLASLEFIRRAARQSDNGSSRRPAAGAARAGEMLGDYRLVREIGRGGMGVVYEAEGLTPGRRLALKVLPLAAALDARQLQRFKNEAQAATLLQHPHIVPVLDVGCEREVHFYVMPLIDGHSLAEVLAALRRPKSDCLDLGGRGSCRAGTYGSAGASPSQAEAPIDLNAPSSARGMADDLASGRWAPPVPASGATRELAASGTAVNSGTASSVVARSPDRATGPDRRSPVPSLGGETYGRPSGTVRRPCHSAGVPFFRTVAHLGVQAAEALEQAHQVGIVHRDIKPGNLLVDARGNLWVTDFGLARLPGEGSLTLTGDLVGTVRYMSPEQALGKRSLVDQRSDIYSLGVTLYELLTLRPAFTGRDRQELLRKIAVEDPLPPRQINRAIPAALETVLLKALAKEPGERYATAQELADDLRCFLIGAPIAARRPGVAERLRKWGRRHRGLVTSAGVMLLLAVAGLAVSTVMVTRERDEARRRAAQAWQAADDFYTRFSQQLLHHQPYLEPVQREFLLKALAFFEDFQQTHSNDPAARFEVAKAARRVGDIRATLGEHPAAARAYEQALTALVSLTGEEPDNVGYRSELAHCHNNRGNFLRDAGRLREAEEDYQRAHRLFDACASAAPNDADFREGRAGSLHNLGMIRHALGRTREAEAAYRQALPEFEGLVLAQPDVPALRHALASARSNLANLLRDTGRPAEALAAYRQADATWQKLVGDFPAIAMYRQAQAAGASGLGVVLAALGRSGEAEQAHRQALALRKRLASDFPRVPAYRQALAASHQSLGRLWAAAGKASASCMAYQRALALRQRLTEEFPSVPAYRQELADSHFGLGSLLLATGKPRDAEQVHRAALTLRQRLIAERPELAEARFDLLRSQRALAEVLQTLGRLAEAETASREAVTLGLRLTAEAPSIPAYRLELAAAWNRLGLLLQVTGRIDEAEKAHRDAQELREKLAGLFPEAPYYRFEVAVGRHYQGTLFQTAGRAREAEEACRQALASAQELSSDIPMQPEYRWLLAACRQDVAELLTATGRSANAHLELAQARPLWEKLAAEFPAYPDYRHELARAEYSKVVLSNAAGKRAEAEAALRRVMAMRAQLVSEFPQVPGYAAELAWSMAAGVRLP